MEIVQMSRRTCHAEPKVGGFNVSRCLDRRGFGGRDKRGGRGVGELSRFYHLFQAVLGSRLGGL